MICDSTQLAWSLAVDELFAYWTSGSDEPSSCPAGGPCGPPAVFAVEHGRADAVKLADLEGTPRFIADGAGLAVGSSTSVVEIDDEGTVHLLAAQGVDGLAVDGSRLYWVGSDDGVIQAVDAPFATSEAVAIAQATGRVIGFDVSDGVIAWAEYPSPGPGTILVLEPGVDQPLVVAQQPLITKLEVQPGRVVSLTMDGALLESAIGASSEPRVLVVDGVSTFDVEGESVYIGHSDGVGGAGISVVPLDGGSTQTLVWYEQTEQHPPPSNLVVVGDVVYWTGRCLFRHPA